MRSTRASAAIARLNSRSEGPRYTLSLTSAGLFKVQEQSEEGPKAIGAALPLDEFVSFVDSLGPQKIRRVTKNDAAFALQLVKKPRE
jgi:hypothetical protein